MKHSVPARALASLLMALCLLSAPVAVLAKKGEKNFKRGVEHEKAQQWERAAQEFALAVAANPSEMEFQLHYRRALFNASQKFMEQGRTLADQGDYRGAYNAYRQAYGYDPVNELAVAEMERMLRLQREREGANGNGNGHSRQSQSGNGNGNGASAVPTSYDTAAGATVAARGAQSARPSQALPPTVGSEPQRVINWNGDLEGFIRKMAEELGLNVLFDRDFPKRTVNFNLKNVTAARALDHVFVAHGLMFQRLDRRTILVADQTKRGQYQQLVLRTFYLQNIDPNDARTLINASLPPNAGRQPVVTPNKATNSITVRDTAENIRLIEELISAIDKDRAEVVMDVSIYEVSRTDLLQLGNQVGDATSLGSLGGLNPLQILVGGPNGRGGFVNGPGTGTGGKGGDTGGKASAVGDALTTAATATAIPTAIGGAFLLPATRLSAFQSKDNTRLLAHTQVHAFDGEQSSTRIGQKVPIQTAQVTPFGGIGGQTTPQQGATAGLFGGNGFPVIQYQDTGLILKFTPQVFPNQDVQVKMEIESNDVIGGANALTPTFSQRSVSGMARIPNNRTMMIASVAQDRESRGSQGLPLLGLIPVLGRLFTTPTRNDSNNDIVITVTPRVLRAPIVTPDDLDIKPAGTLQAPVTGTLEALVHEAEREEQLAAARQLPTNASVDVPTAASVETASLHHAPPKGAQANQVAAAAPQGGAQPAEAEQHDFVPAPKILAGVGDAGAGGMTAVNAFAPASTAFVPAIHTVDPPPPAAGASATKPATDATSVAGATAGAISPVEKAAASVVAATTALDSLAPPQAELYIVPGQSEMRVGTRQRLMVFIKTPTPLTLAAANLKFDPKVLAVRSVTKGSLFAEGGAQPSVTQSVDESGFLLALVAPAVGSPVTGMGVLLFVEVEALKAGESSVGFEQTGVHLMSADGRSLPARGSQIRLAVKR